MSFSQDVRIELSRQISAERHCNLAELSALVVNVGEITAISEGFRLKIRTENVAIARKCFTLLKKTFNIGVSVSAWERKNGKRKEKSYLVSVDRPKEGLLVLDALLLLDDSRHLADAKTVANPDLLKQSCCRRAYLRGAFLSAGSMSNPERSYHFELVVPSMERATQLTWLIHSFGPEARIVPRKNTFVVYVKEGAQIVDMLNIMEAHVSLMELENIRIVREMRNTVNRRVNCEAANINKTVSAAVRQTEEIKALVAAKGLEHLPEGLREIATLRLEHPDASLKELGELLDPPIGKSGVNHRLRKLSGLAEQMREGSVPNA